VQGLPVWARVLAVIGVPGLIAVFLVWQGAAELPRIARAQEGIQRQLDQLQIEVTRHHADTQDQLRLELRLLLRVCVNTAATETDRQKCFDK
jgi:hypothetical protein